MGIVSLLKFDAEASVNQREMGILDFEQRAKLALERQPPVLPLLLETRFVGQVYRVPERPLQGSERLVLMQSQHTEIKWFMNEVLLNYLGDLCSLLVKRNSHKYELKELNRILPGIGHTAC